MRNKQGRCSRVRQGGDKFYLMLTGLYGHKMDIWVGEMLQLPAPLVHVSQQASWLKNQC